MNNTQIEKIQLSAEISITFTLKYNALNIFEEPQNNLWTFDLGGRLIGFYYNGKTYRRTLDNNYYLKSRQIVNRQVFRTVTKISKPTIIPLIKNIHELIKQNIILLPAAYTLPLKNILRMDFLTLENSATEFSNIYLPISILPPDQYLSLVIQITEGCNYNQCTFCNFYRDRPFKIKSDTQLRIHLKQIKRFFGKGISYRKSIFLGDANALVVPQDRLISGLKIIRQTFPQFENIYSFIDVFTGIKKTTSDFKILKSLGIKRVYLGVESGNFALMSFLNKNQSNTDIIELTNNLKSANINIGIIFLIGSGGEHFAQQHQQDSIKLLKQLPLSKGDIIYLSELYETNSEYVKSMLHNKFALPTKLQIRKWSKEFKSAIDSILLKDVKVSTYDINQFFY